jgi:hypothetical protein
MPSEADGDHGHSSDDGVLLPIRQRDRRQQIIIADDRIGLMQWHQGRRLTDADTWDCVDAQRLEVSAEMLTQKRMSTDAQHSHVQNIPRGRRDVQRFEGAGARDLCHAAHGRACRGMDRALLAV